MLRKLTANPMMVAWIMPKPKPEVMAATVEPEANKPRLMTVNAWTN